MLNLLNLNIFRLRQGYNGFEWRRRSQTRESIDFRQWLVGEKVGCIAVDKLGNCAAVASMGRLTNKMVGQIRNTPIAAAGTYAMKCAVLEADIEEYII